MGEAIREKVDLLVQLFHIQITGSDDVVVSRQHLFFGQQFLHRDHHLTERLFVFHHLFLQIGIAVFQFTEQRLQSLLFILARHSGLDFQSLIGMDAYAAVSRRQRWFREHILGIIALQGDIPGLADYL